jgi:hypothetical protein
MLISATWKAGMKGPWFEASLGKKVIEIPLKQITQIW